MNLFGYIYITNFFHVNVPYTWHAIIYRAILNSSHVKWKQTTVWMQCLKWQQPNVIKLKTKERRRREKNLRGAFASGAACPGSLCDGENSGIWVGERRRRRRRIEEASSSEVNSAEGRKESSERREKDASTLERRWARRSSGGKQGEAGSRRWITSRVRRCGIQGPRCCCWASPGAVGETNRRGCGGRWGFGQRETRGGGYFFSCRGLCLWFLFVLSGCVCVCECDACSWKQPQTRSLVSVRRRKGRSLGGSVARRRRL